MANPLFTYQALPPFSLFSSAMIQPAVEQAIEQAKQAVEQVVAQQIADFRVLSAQLDEADERLHRVWSPVSHLNSVMSESSWREAHDACLPLLSQYSTWLGQHQGLFRCYQQAKEQQYAQLTTAEQKALDDALLEFELSGIGLEAAAQQRYKAINLRLSELTSNYSNNVLDATQAWSLHIEDEQRLAGLPESAIAMAAEAAQEKELGGWLLTLEFPCYYAVISYADDRSLRETLYRAYVTRASDEGPNAGEFDNSALMDEIVALRHEKAQLLGFSSYAHYSLARKMANEPSQVFDFLNDLARRSKPQAQQELAELKSFAVSQGCGDPQPWDFAYYGEKLKEQRFDVTDEMLRPYFPEQQVIQGLFAICQQLFGLRFEQDNTVDVWHDDVRFYRVYDAQEQARGGFYFDLYARSNKRGGAWMDDCLGRRVHANGSIQQPIAYLTCNLNKPTAGKPALFTHDEVVTLFHEFGHGLHHMMTLIDVPAVAGINGVPWDAVELPSQFLENWCWQQEGLALISGHYQTGEPLPAQLLNKLLAARHFQSAMMMVRQLEFSLFDFHLHHDTQYGSIAAVLKQVREQVAVVQAPEFNRFAHSFSHIFAGGYAAGYYSYKWAEVLSADAFARFEEEGVMNAQVGKDFMDNILTQGGSRPAMELFIAFRGREPQVDALLRHSGIAA